MLQGLRCLFIGSIIWLTGMAVTAATSNVPPEIIKWSQHNVMQVVTAAGTGSGFWIDEGVGVTACHVVSKTLLIYNRDEKTGEMIKTTIFEIIENVIIHNWDYKHEARIEILSCDTETDIAIFRLKDKRDVRPVFQFTRTYGHIQEYGDAVYCPGYGMSLNLHITTGHYQGREMGYKEYDLLTCNTVWGDSGSPAIALVDGVVVFVGVRQAVVNGQNHPIGHLTLSRPADTIEELVANTQELVANM